MGLGIRNTLYRLGHGAATRIDISRREVHRAVTEAVGQRLEVAVRRPDGQTRVDEYWNRHLLNPKPFLSARESEEYLSWRNAIYPLFPEFMGLYAGYEGQHVLDYGCGPGNDLVGFLLHSDARLVTGMDISPKVLGLAGHRVNLHRVPPERVRLVQVGDAKGLVPLDDATVDHVHSAGVLHHTSHPEEILREFHRVLKPAGTATVMVYNRSSVMFNLFIAYQRMLVENAFEGLSVDEAFQRSTDGEDCPISIAYKPSDFARLCTAAGFETEFVGGYPATSELDWARLYAAPAAAEERLAGEHRQFARALAKDESGYPVFEGKHAGIGGVYRLRRR